jgi:hypothetical protein
MKVLTSIISVLFFCTYSVAQTSYDFTNTLPPNSPEISSVPKSFFGVYSSDSADIDYEFSAKGVFAISTIYNQISRETVRESSKYRVENGYLFGVQKDDSIPCILEGEYYVFSIKNREQIVGGTAPHKLVQLTSNSFVVNFKENETFTPSLFEFKGKKLSIRHFTYETETAVFHGIASQKSAVTNLMNTISLNPTIEEWNAIPLTSIMTRPILFKR